MYGFLRSSSWCVDPVELDLGQGQTGQSYNAAMVGTLSSSSIFRDGPNKTIKSEVSQRRSGEFSKKVNITESQNRDVQFPGDF